MAQFVEELRYKASFIGILHLQNPSGRTMDLDWTQPLTLMSTRNISSVVKAVGA